MASRAMMGTEKETQRERQVSPSPFSLSSRTQSDENGSSTPSILRPWLA